MNHDHLTSEEMEALLMEPESMDRSTHLAQCELCMEEFESLHATIADLRVAVKASASQQYRLGALEVRFDGRPRMMWGLVVAAALICVTGPLVLHSRPSDTDDARVSQAQVQATVSESDAQLLSNVEDDVSASVPSAMLPLASTDTANLNGVSTSVSKENE